MIAQRKSQRAINFIILKRKLSMTVQYVIKGMFKKHVRFVTILTTPGDKNIFSCLFQHPDLSVIKNLSFGNVKIVLYVVYHSVCHPLDSGLEALQITV